MTAGRTIMFACCLFMGSVKEESANAHAEQDR